jgi:DNA polymerase III epsilon subunit-like protein
MDLNKYKADYYLCIDIETTDFKPEEGSEITEIAVAEVNEGCVVRTYSSLIKTEKEIPEHITELTGINDSMVQKGKSLPYILNQMMGIFDLYTYNQNIVIHNVNFDKNFISYFLDKHDSDCWNLNNFICSLELSKIVLPNQSHKLNDLKEYFGIKTRGHRALNDVLSTIKVYEELKKLL